MARYKVYFADPHRPLQSGINETPTGCTDSTRPRAPTSRYSQDDLEDIAFDLNVRPRKSLGWKCPLSCSCPSPSTTNPTAGKMLRFPLEVGLQ